MGGEATVAGSQGNPNLLQGARLGTSVSTPSPSTHVARAHLLLLQVCIRLLPRGVVNLNMPGLTIHLNVLGVHVANRGHVLQWGEQQVGADDAREAQQWGGADEREARGSRTSTLRASTPGCGAHRCKGLLGSRLAPHPRADRTARAKTAHHTHGSRAQACAHAQHKPAPAR